MVTRVGACDHSGGSVMVPRRRQALWRTLGGEEAEEAHVSALDHLQRTPCRKCGRVATMKRKLCFDVAEKLISADPRR